MYECVCVEGGGGESPELLPSFGSALGSIFTWECKRTKKYVCHQGAFALRVRKENYQYFHPNVPLSRPVRLF